MKDNKIIGEIIEVSSRSAIAQSYELYGCPPIGSVVKCGDDKEDIYGVITNIETRSIDPGRRPNPKGPGFAEVNELYKSNPEITHLMKTEFNIVFLGYKNNENTTEISIPPTPPRIFSFISTLPEDEMINIFSDEGLVKFIVNSNMELKDDVIIMIISKYLNSKKNKTEEIGSFTSQLVGALPDQITRITNIIQNLNLQEK